MDSQPPAFTPEEVQARIGAMAMDLLLNLMPALIRAGVVKGENLRSVVRVHEVPPGVRVNDELAELDIVCHRLRQFAEQIDERDRVAIRA